MYNVGDWVAVLYDEEWYPGNVQKTGLGKLEIKFMTHCGQYFKWPTKPDVQIISDDGVLCHLEEPISVTSRIFKFIDTPVTNALSKLE